MTQTPFSSLPLSKEVLRAIDEMGFEGATEIQAKTIPQILEGHDIIGRSQTGTGKTAAFAIPSVEMTDGHDKRNVQVLVVCPTRELAIQNWGVMKRLYKYKTGVKACAVFGGQQIERQIRELRKGVNIIIGTPGRIMDHMRRKTLKLDNIKMIVLDEADEMLDMGFREDIESILSKTPETRQTVFFSATMPPAIMAITEKFQKDPVIIEVNKSQITLDAIKHFYSEVGADQKELALTELIKQHDVKKSIIFCNTQKMVDKLNKFLIANHFRSVAIHGGMKQNVRTVVMANFKKCEEGFLVATDVAARGIDARGIDAVINYDIPANTEYYIHRTGRTARAGNKGDAYTIVTNRAQALMLRDIERAVKVKMEFDDLLKKGGPTLLRNIPENIHGKRAQFGRRGNNRAPRGNGNFSRIEINIGKKNFVAPSNIVRAIAEKTTLSGGDIGKINIQDKTSVVEVPTEHLDEVLASLKDSKINRLPVTATAYTGPDFPRSHGGFDKRSGGHGGHGGNGGHSFHGGNGGHYSHNAHSDNEGGHDKPFGGKKYGKRDNASKHDFSGKRDFGGKRDFTKHDDNGHSNAKKRRTF